MLLSWIGDILLDSFSAVLNFFYNLFNLPALPLWLANGLNYIIDAMTSAVGLVSWMFPNENIWLDYIGFIVIVETIVFSIHIFKFIMKLWNTFKP